jgi:16S rRNA (cytidine1402-2'-O)-methyltransferase
MSGKIYLIPSPLGDNPVEEVIPAKIKEVVKQLKYFIVEDLRTARRYLKKLDENIDIDSLQFFECSEHTEPAEKYFFIKPALDGNNIGLMSEAGVPCVADPGAMVVFLAHEKGIQVVPLSGPSSIIQGLMASGLGGQNFTFHGYLPVKSPERVKRIKELENISFQTKYTQVFMETPYRNNQLLEDILKTCNHHTMLCIACNIGQPTELIQMKTIEAWQQEKPDLNKRPAVFLLR